MKPDIVGAACGETALRPLNEISERGFCGTSQAAPHVAGMAALVRQRFPDYTPAQVAAYLKEHAQQRVTPDPNNTWGARLRPTAVPGPGSAGCSLQRHQRRQLAGKRQLDDLWSAVHLVRRHH